MFPRRKHVAENKDADWRRFISVFFKVFISGLGAIYLFILLVDPFDIIPFALPLERAMVSVTSQRHMYPQIVRSGRFNSFVIGTSSIRLLDPKLLDQEFDARFANVAMNSATAWEQQKMMEYIIHKAGPPKVLIVGLDHVWCNSHADRERITARGFPDWMYDDNPWNDYLYLLNSSTLEIAGRLVAYQFGFHHLRMRFDGYQVFVPPESKYDVTRARQHIWDSRKSEPPPDVPPPPLLPVERAALTFPALAWLDATLAKLPRSTLAILAFMPAHVVAQPWPGTHAAAIEAECKARIADIARIRGAKVVDWRINSVLTRNDANFWDRFHYRVPIATRIAEQLGAAVLTGHNSDDGSYRIVVP